MDSAEKTRENRLRRVAARRFGWRLEKSRSRDPLAFGYGTYRLVDVATNTVARAEGPSGYGLTLDDVESALGG